MGAAIFTPGLSEIVDVQQIFEDANDSVTDLSPADAFWPTISEGNRRSRLQSLYKKDQKSRRPIYPAKQAFKLKAQEPRSGLTSTTEPAAEIPLTRGEKRVSPETSESTEGQQPKKRNRNDRRQEKTAGGDFSKTTSKPKNSKESKKREMTKDHEMKDLDGEVEMGEGSMAVTKCMTKLHSLGMRLPTRSLNLIRRGDLSLQFQETGSEA